jgi:hypothetical protein
MTADQTPNGDPNTAAQALVKASQWEALLVSALFIGLLGGGGVLLAVAMRNRSVSDPALHAAMGLIWLGLGLITLVRMAVFGRRPNQSPAREAMIGAGQVLLGAAQLTAQDTVQMMLIVMSCVMMVLAIVNRPRRLFAISARTGGSQTVPR